MKVCAGKRGHHHPVKSQFCQPPSAGTAQSQVWLGPRWPHHAGKVRTCAIISSAYSLRGSEVFLREQLSLLISMGYNHSRVAGGCSCLSCSHFPLPGVSTWATYIFVNAGFNLELCRKGKLYFIPKLSMAIVRIEM